MRGRSAATTDLDGLYAAQRLSMVRLAYLLLGDRDVAESVVQRAFLVLKRRPDRHPDPGSVVAGLRARVVSGCRTAARARRIGPPGSGVPRDAADDVLALPLRQREVVVLQVWGRLGRTQTAATVRAGERTVASAGTTAIESLRHASEPPDGSSTVDRVAEALERRADTIGADDLRGRFAEVLDTDTRITARHRRWWLVAVAALIVVAAVVAAVVGVQRYSSPAPVLPSPSVTQAAEPLSSPALTPGEGPRSAIPWVQVGPGWSVIVTATPATAITTTALLVSPDGRRYGLGSSPQGIVVQDVSADGRHVMVAIGSQAQDWDLQAGTARDLATPYGWKSLRYLGPDPSYGYLVLVTDSTSTVRLQRWTSDGSLRVEYDAPLASTAGSPRHPGALVSPNGATALLSSRDGPLQLLDLATDTIASPGPFDEAPSCEPVAPWSNTQALVVCTTSVQVNAYDNLVGRPLLITPVGGTPVRAAAEWPTSGAPVVQYDDLCSTSLATQTPDGRLLPLHPPGPAADLVPNTAVSSVLYLGGSRCADDGDRLVAYDLASGRTTVLAGPDAGGRTVRQAVVLGTPQ